MMLCELMDEDLRANLISVKEKVSLKNSTLSCIDLYPKLL